jgi:hypothetical protein
MDRQETAGDSFAKVNPREWNLHKEKDKEEEDKLFDQTGCICKGESPGR